MHKELILIKDKRINLRNLHLRFLSLSLSSARPAPPDVPGLRPVPGRPDPAQDRQGQRAADRPARGRQVPDHQPGPGPARLLRSRLRDQRPEGGQEPAERVSLRRRRQGWVDFCRCNNCNSSPYSKNSLGVVYTTCWNHVISDTWNRQEKFQEGEL